MSQKAITRKSNVDWACVRQEYEGSLISGRALAEKYGVTPASVSFHVRSKGWKRPDEFAQHAAIKEFKGAKLKAPALEVTAGGELVPMVGSTHLTSVPISADIEALAALRDRILSQHKVSISRDMAYLDVLQQNLMEKKSAPLQKLNALQTIVKIRVQLVELERQAHSMVAGGDAGKGVTNVQVNVNVSPQDAYRAMLEGGK